METNGTKQCKVCGDTKPVEAFVPKRNKCKDCHNAYYRTYFRTHEDQREKRRVSSEAWAKTEKGVAYIKVKNREYHADHREERVARVREWRTKLWDGLLEKYGKECGCCHESERLFLTIDHVNRDGRADRAKHGGHRQLYYWLSKQPRMSDYQTLCYNCNCGRERNGGVCPHELKKLE